MASMRDVRRLALMIYWNNNIREDEDEEDPAITEIKRQRRIEREIAEENAANERYRRERERKLKAKKQRREEEEKRRREEEERQRREEEERQRREEEERQRREEEERQRREEEEERQRQARLEARIRYNKVKELLLINDSIDDSCAKFLESAQRKLEESIKLERETVKDKQEEFDFMEWVRASDKQHNQTRYNITPNPMYYLRHPNIDDSYNSGDN